MKNFYSLFLTLCLAASATAANYSVYVGGTQVTDANAANVLGDGKVKFEASSSTLILDGASISANANSGIQSFIALNILVRGTNTISLSSPGTGNAGIYCLGKLKIYTDTEFYPASLTVNSNSQDNCALLVYNDLEVSGFMTLDLRGWNASLGAISASKVTIDGATVKIAHGEKVNTTGITISNAEITSPSGAKLSADTKSFVASNGSALPNPSQVVVSSLFRQLTLGVDPKTSANSIDVSSITLGSKHITGQSKFLVLKGEKLTLKANAVEGYELYAWQYIDKSSVTHTYTDENPTDFTMDDNTSVVYAKFEKTYKFDLSVQPKNVGNIAICNGDITESSLNYSFGSATPIQLEAIPAYGYNFAGWYYGDNVLISTNNSVKIYKVAEDETVYAKFVKDETVVDKVSKGAYQINNDKDYVRFSMGNLQYQPFTHFFRFAAEQQITIGEDNKNISENSIDWYDLFGWGTGDDPVKASNSASDFKDYNEWGDNPIVNGGNESNKWRTLTESEWRYIFSARPDADKKWGLASLYGKKGIVLLPDNFSLPDFINYEHKAFNDNILDGGTWNFMESKGAIFLPATGTRFMKSSIDKLDNGYYWTATKEDNSYSQRFLFDSEGIIGYGKTYNYYGHAVRLVQACESPSTAIDQISQEPIANSQKLLKNGQLVILRGNKVYTIQGQEVK